ncbi:MAG: right-handed parallel beta-helix repeat-containing protein, partial [Thermoplasmata archaeon]|nr:right-handed parallel beta-helix repeat-containing protein [Thermoplasmata archaeon]
MRKLSAMILCSILVLTSFVMVIQMNVSSSEPQDTGMYTPHAPIRINSNADFGIGINGVTAGNGTVVEPWIIENWDINGTGFGNCLYIGNTTDYFEVRNCYLHDASGVPSWRPWLSDSSIILNNADNGRIENNTIASNDDEGISFEGTSKYNYVIDNTIINNDFGITLWSGNNNTIQNNNISNNIYDGLDFYSSHDTIIDNNTIHSNRFGIDLRWSDRNIITNNSISGNSLNSMYLYDTHNNYIYGNHLSNNAEGVYLQSSENNNFTNNDFSGEGIYITGYSIEYWNSHSIDTSNTVNGKPLVYWKNRTTGTVPLGAGQVILANCSNVIVEDQDIDEAYVGILLGYSDNNQIRNNDLLNNKYGMMIFPNTFSNFNLIYHNNFINNTVQAYENSTNSWNSTYSSGGNYWSDYNGTDNFNGPLQNIPGNDGIGDTPYTFSSGQDNYPLMEPYEQVVIEPEPSDIDVYTIPRYPLGTDWTLGSTSGEDGDIITVNIITNKSIDYVEITTGYCNRTTCYDPGMWVPLTLTMFPTYNLFTYQLPGDEGLIADVYEASSSLGSYVYYQIYMENSTTWDYVYYPDFNGNDQDLQADEIAKIYPAWPPTQTNATTTVSKTMLEPGETFWVNGSAHYWNSTYEPGNSSALIPVEHSNVSISINPTYTGMTDADGDYSFEITAPVTPGFYNITTSVTNDTANWNGNQTRNVPCLSNDIPIEVILMGNQTTDDSDLIIALQDDMQNMNYFDPDTNEVWKSNQLQYNFESLMSYNPDFELYPVLAGVNAAGPHGADIIIDGLNFTVNLRQNATFSDGTPMTSKDVVFSYQTLGWGLYQTPILQCLYWDSETFKDWDGVANSSHIGVEAVDNYTVKFYLTQPFAMFWFNTLSLPIIPEHIWSDHMNPANAPGYDTSLDWQLDYSYGSDPSETDATIGTGPWYLESWTPGNGSIIKANENYWDMGGITSWAGIDYPNYPDHVRTINFDIYTQLDVAVQSLQNGDVHHLPWSLSSGYYNQLKTDPGIGIEQPKDQGLFYLSFNQRKGAMADVEFRRAVSYCIDKDYIVDSLMGGYGIKGSVPISVTNDLYVNSSVPDWILGGNLTKANTALNDAGYYDYDGDGWRDMPDGSPLNYNILTPLKDYDPIRADTGLMIEKNLRMVGLNVRSVPTSFDTLVSSAFVSVDFDMYILGWTVGSFPESYLRDFFHSDMDTALNPTGSNAGGYHNVAVDQMIGAMEVEMDTDKRAQYVKDICGA